MAKRLASRWDTYTKEAAREPVELEMPDGEILTIPFPSKRTIDLVNKARRSDDDQFVLALMGAEQGRKLLDAAIDAPAGALQRMLGDVMVEFGLWKRNPFDPDYDGEDDDLGNLRRSSRL